MAANRPFQSVKYIVPLIVASSAWDSLLKEQPWIPDQAKQYAFYLLGPISVIGMVLVIPYIKARLEIVTPRRTSNFVLIVLIGISAVAVVDWILMYYEVTWIGSNSINSTALFLKDTVLVSSAVILLMLAVRLSKWYRIARNRFVLLYAVFAVTIAGLGIMHILSDYFSRPEPQTLIRATAVSFESMYPGGALALVLLIRAYFGRTRKWIAFVLFTPLTLLQAVIMFSVIFQIQLGYTLRTISLWGLVAAGPTYLTSFLLVSPTVKNPVAKEYYRGLGYGVGMLAGATCGMGLGVSPNFPLSGFPSLTTLVHGACLAFATFTSAASYFSISENIRRDIRESKAFVTSIGEAENRIVVERQVSEFYDRFTRLAQASGAVEAEAISKDEIYSYATTVKKMLAT